MDTLTFIHQGVLFAHLLTFAVALATVLREDLALLRARRIDQPRLARTARTLTAALAVLWLTGIALVTFHVGLHPRAFWADPKTAAKLLVVSALTLNGFALHTLAFPRLRVEGEQDAAGATLPVVLGAISTASWLYASFVGASRLVAPAMSLADFMALYGGVLAGAVAGALVFIRPRVARMLLAAR
jgi:hypothetical protein